MTALTNPNQIERYHHWAVLRSGIRLEAKGMKLSRGRSVTKIARVEFNMPKATREELIAHLDNLLK